MIKIQKNIAIPPSTRTLGAGQSKYPLINMEIGDSFAIPARTPLAAKRAVATLSNAKTRFYKKYPDYKFAIRKMENEVRIWRIK